VRVPRPAGPETVTLPGAVRRGADSHVRRDPLRPRPLAAFALSLSLALLALARPAGAQLPLGAAAPAFTKSLLGGGGVSAPGQYAGKVVVLFLLGYG